MLSSQILIHPLLWSILVQDDGLNTVGNLGAVKYFWDSERPEKRIKQWALFCGLLPDLIAHLKVSFYVLCAVAPFGLTSLDRTLTQRKYSICQWESLCQHTPVVSDKCQNIGSNCFLPHTLGTLFPSINLCQVSRRAAILSHLLPGLTHSSFSTSTTSYVCIMCPMCSMAGVFHFYHLMTKRLSYPSHVPALSFHSNPHKSLMSEFLCFFLLAGETTGL